MAIKLQQTGGHVNLAQKLAKGDPFRYEDFTEEQLAALKGEKGETGVYVGTEEPTDDSVLVWFYTEPDVVSNGDLEEY